MALSKLDNLYMAVVSEHSKTPHHHGDLTGVDSVTLSNPTCGDVVNLYVQFEGDNISDIAFSGHGCSISTASASMMTDVMIGKTKEEALALADVFSEMVQGKKSDKEEQLGDASFLSGVSKFPQRIKCATLSWHALKKAVTDNQTKKENN
ncbi:Fe-S cluster assembly sulfur transfer protein SufU [Streptococcus zalophi]|uniref:SUF system NifU family Fe-S cluster assembly protein n=1 Tax=Streptococcus zalophi TaxID=640031 RepID=A0A934UDH9_9STRE|nr:SUF system NifU family Fe-S cluster assembly protein [Streptococcus zalophi]MBJ8349815.1 SUF system NifU family Fe-S cluster assembly protein [Streptococcus zalophi]MCR8967584.1 SUF system NifU family Fe-S cluster assembly protein [Streptococcus zalophi]